VYTVDCDFSDEDVQEDYIELALTLNTCSGCDDDWVIEGTVSNWYSEFQNWVS
jgi:hypothetical protein